MVKIYAALIFSNIFTVLAQLCLKKVAISASTSRSSFSFLSTVLSSNWLWPAILFFGLSFLLSIIVLSKLELLRVFPISYGLGYALISVTAYFAFGEKLSITNFAGVGLVFIGIYFLLIK